MNNVRIKVRSEITYRFQQECYQACHSCMQSSSNVLHVESQMHAHELELPLRPCGARCLPHSNDHEDGLSWNLGHCHSPQIPRTGFRRDFGWRFRWKGKLPKTQWVKGRNCKEWVFECKAGINKGGKKMSALLASYERLILAVSLSQTNRISSDNKAENDETHRPL